MDAEAVSAKQDHILFNASSASASFQLRFRPFMPPDSEHRPIDNKGAALDGQASEFGACDLSGAATVSLSRAAAAFWPGLTGSPANASPRNPRGRPLRFRLVASLIMLMRHSGD